MNLFQDLLKELNTGFCQTSVKYLIADVAEYSKLMGERLSDLTLNEEEIKQCTDLVDSINATQEDFDQVEGVQSVSNLIEHMYHIKLNPIIEGYDQFIFTRRLKTSALNFEDWKRFQTFEIEFYASFVKTGQTHILSLLTPYFKPSKSKSKKYDFGDYIPFSTTTVEA